MHIEDYITNKCNHPKLCNVSGVRLDVSNWVIKMKESATENTLLSVH